MTDRRFRPGIRPGTPAMKLGKMNDSRIAWCRTAIGEMVLHRYPTPEDEDPDEMGDSFVILIPTPGRKPARINLTALTMEELKVLREFLTLSLDAAEPIVAQRDKVAQDAAAKGDDSHARVYRPVPQLVKRPSFNTDGQGVRERPVHLLGGPRRGESGPVGVRGDGDELAPAEAPGGSAKDDQEAHN